MGIFLKKSSSTGPSLRMQSFRNRIPHVCQQNLLLANVFLQAALCCRDPTAALAFQGLQFQSGYLLHWGSPWDSLHHGLQRNLYSTVWITSSLCFTLDLGVCRVFLTYNSHSSLPAAVAQKFVPLLFTLKNTAFSTTLQKVLYYVFSRPCFSSASTSRLLSFQY